MTDFSRRQVLQAIGGALAGALTAAARGEKPALDGTLIDAHVHLNNTGLVAGAAARPRPKEVAAAAKAAGVGVMLGMPTSFVSDTDPLGIRAALDFGEELKLLKGPKVHPIGFAHPERYDRDHLRLVEDVLGEGKVKGLKAYLGYLPYGPSAPGYRPYYRLAAKYKVPVIFHTGDTLSKTAKVKYAHPLRVDEVAVDYPDTKFVLAHFGNPWVMDAAQVVYKNANVYAELSAFLIGNEKAWVAMEKDGVVGRTVKRVMEGIEYAEAPERFLYGSDYPLSPMTAYRDFVRRMFPKDQHDGVFRDNAKKLFGL
jgi:hypothetical protein